MRLLFLSQFYQPEPAFMGAPFMRRLVDGGMKVEVLTGFPNYPGGKVYPGYRVRAYRQEMLDGIRVHRAPLYPSHDASGLRRMANYLSFGLGALVFGAPRVRPARVVFCYNLVTLIFAATFLKLRDGAKVVQVVQDLWPESVAGSGMMGNRVLLALLRGCCDVVYRSADRLVVIAPGMKERLVSRGVDPGRVRVIYNWSEQESDVGLAPRDAELAGRHGLTETFNVMYAGNMGVMQSLDTVLDAAKRLAASHPRVRLVLLGGGMERERLEARARSEGLANVVFLPRQHPEMMPRVYSLADAVLVHLKDIELFRITVPSKTQACLAAGLPILMGVRGDAGTLVERSGGGLAFEPEDAASLAAAVSRLVALPAEELRAMGRRGRAFYLEKLSAAAGTRAYAAVFRELDDGDAIA